MIDALLIAGATASGKSSLGLAVAQALDGVIINADSMQVYRGMEVLTASPSVEDKAAVAHRLYNYVEPSRPHSAALWLEDATQALAAVRSADKLPIVIGGTGLYLRALEQGLAEIPPIPETIRQQVRSDLAAMGPEGLHVQLEAVDPVMAERLAPGDSSRIVRALEVVQATGRSLADFQATSHAGPLAQSAAQGRILACVVEWPREALYARCDERFVTMLDAGAEAEVAALAKLGLAHDNPIMKALGVPMIMAHQRGEIDRATMIDEGQRQTRRYAKRQLTWWRNQCAHWPRIDGRDRVGAARDIIAAVHDNREIRHADIS